MDADKIRAAFLEKFRQVASERVQRILELFDQLVKTPADGATADVLARELHTLKGESRMMGFQNAGKIVHTLESALKIQRGQKFARLPTYRKLFERSLDAVISISHQSAGIDVDGLCREIESQGAEEVASEDPEARGAPSRAPPLDPQAAPQAAASQAAPQVAASQAAPQADGKPSPSGAPQAATPAAEEPQQMRTGLKLSNLVRVSAAKLDRLNNSVADLFSSHLRMNEFTRNLGEVAVIARDLAKPGRAVQTDGNTEIQDLYRRLRQLRRSLVERQSAMSSQLDQILDQVSEIRLLPVADLFHLYRTAARDIARQLEKDVTIELQGESTQVDRSILDALGDVLLHIVRNALDHGIEPEAERRAAGKPGGGRLILRAATVNDRIQIEVEDDGRGLDPKRIRRVAKEKGLIDERAASALSDEDALDFIFRPGFSTASVVTDLSGRGVGLDVVRTRLQDLGGSTHVESTPGRGTRFTMELPTTIAIARVLLLRVLSQTFAILATFVRRVDKVDPGTLIDSPLGQAILVDGHTTAAVPAAELLRLGQPAPVNGRLPLVIIEHGGRQLALIVDELLGERELSIKPFSAFLAGIRSISGAAVLEDGSLILVLHAGELCAAGSRIKRTIRTANSQEVRRIHRVLLVEDSLITRELERSVLMSYGLEVEEAADGAEAIDRLAAGQFDLVVSDVEMPRLNGFELTQRIKADGRFSHLPVILVTTLGSEQDRKRGLQSGADGYIVKSEFGSQLFIEMVRRFLP